MATLTITTTAPQDSRIVAAFGTYLGLKDAQGVPRVATAAEVKANVIAYITGVVHGQEYNTVKATAEASLPTQITPT